MLHRREADVYRVMLMIVEKARPRSRGRQGHAHWPLQAKMLLDYEDQSVRALSVAHFLSHSRAFGTKCPLYGPILHWPLLVQGKRVRGTSLIKT